MYSACAYILNFLSTKHQFDYTPLVEKYNLMKEAYKDKKFNELTFFRWHGYSKARNVKLVTSLGNFNTDSYAFAAVHYIRNRLTVLK